MDNQPTKGPAQSDQDQAPGRKRIEELARVSWLAPLAACVVGFVLRSMLQDATGQTVVAGVQVLFIVFGLVCGVIALFKVGKYGKKKILLPAVVGVSIVLVFIAAAIIALPTIRKAAHERQVAVATEIALKARRFEAPLGFVDCPEGKQQKDVIWSYVKGKGEGLENSFFIFVVDMGGTIGNENTSPHLVGRPNVSVFKEKWNDQDIEVARIKETLSGVNMLTFNAQVPLLPHALQVKVIGAEKREEELRGIVKQALANLKGVTNWK